MNQETHDTEPLHNTPDASDNNSSEIRKPVSRRTKVLRFLICYFSLSLLALLVDYLSTVTIPYGDYRFQIIGITEAKVTEYRGEATEIVLPTHFLFWEVTQMNRSVIGDNENLQSIEIRNRKLSVEYSRGNSRDVTPVVYISASVNEINSLVSLWATNYVVSEANAYYSDIDGVLYDKDRTTLIHYPPRRLDNRYTIPCGILSIADNAFAASNLVSIDIPDTVAAIGRYAFSSCSQLKEVKLPEGLSIIPSGIFYACPALTSVYIPESVTMIDYSAFAACFSLKSIDISKNVTLIEFYSEERWRYRTSEMMMELPLFTRSPFTANHALESINVDPENPEYTSVDGVLFTKKLTDLLQYPASKPESFFEIPEGVRYITADAFEFNKYLEHVTFPSSLLEIFPQGFAKCESLKEATFNDGLWLIGYMAFTKCNELREVKLPETLRYLGAAAFSYCPNLERVRLPEKEIQTLSDHVFFASPKLTYYGVPGSWAELFASKMEMPFKSLDEWDIPD
ncbi:MAG: leucine-rich repeat domain-containing protein [Symbiobacteriaceae bacterium]|nr:leucine-rich repeat domain-containing protein [Symbiobacteriaceae bacterium]